MGVKDRVRLATATDILRRRLLENLMLSGVTIVDPSTTFIDADVVIGQDTVIEPFTVLRGATRIGASVGVKIAQEAAGARPSASTAAY